MMKNRINYFFVPADKIGLVLLHLDAYGWRFDECLGCSAPIQKYYVQATSRDYDGHKCVFKLEEYKNYNLISITTDLLMAANKQNDEVRTYSDFKNKVGL